MGKMSAMLSAVIYFGAFFITIQNIGKIIKKDVHSNIIYVKTDNHLSSKMAVGEYIGVLLAALPFILVYGLRFQVGADYTSYLNYYNFVRNSGEVELFGYFEPGYVLLNLIAAKVFHEGYGIFLTVGIVIVSILYKIILQYGNNIFAPFLIYIFCMVYFGASCNVVRQMIAVIVCAYAYYYIIDRKIGKFALCIFIAALFHKSALFCAFFYFITYIKGSVETILFKIMCCLLGLGCIVFRKQILLFVVYTKLYSGHIATNGSGLRGFSFLLYVVPVLLLIELAKGSLMSKKREYQFFVLLMWLQIPIQCCGLFNQALERMSLYCSIAQIILVPAIVKSIRDPLNRKIWGGIFCLWYLFHFIAMEIYLPGNGINHYQLWNF